MQVTPRGHSGGGRVVLEFRARHGATALEQALVTIIQKHVEIHGGDVQARARHQGLSVATYTATYGPVYGGPAPAAGLFPLAITVEILINGSWVDISAYALQRDGIQITGGRTARGDTSQPAQATLTLNNRDGRFSPNYTSGTYYPYLQRNVQLRISVNDTSSSGNVYNGFRFWGEVSEWPPLSDLSGDDVYVQVTASGPLRRIRKGGGEGSALQRYYATLTGLYAPVAYWPCEEDPNSGLIGPGVQGGANMTVVSGAPKWKAISDFNGSAPIGVINKSTWTGVTSAFGTSGDDLYLAPGTYQWIASTTTVNVKVVSGGGGGTKGQGNTAAGGSSGGGSAWAGNTAVAVTPGLAYPVTVGAGGTFGLWDQGANDGGTSSFTGDAVSVIADPGKGANASAAAGGRGLAASSTGTVTHNGGSGAGNPSFFNGGAGGGSSGGSGGRRELRVLPDQPVRRRWWCGPVRWW